MPCLLAGYGAQEAFRLPVWRRGSDGTALPFLEVEHSRFPPCGRVLTQLPLSRLRIPRQNVDPSLKEGLNRERRGHHIFFLCRQIKKHSKISSDSCSHSPNAYALPDCFRGCRLNPQGCLWTFPSHSTVFRLTDQSSAVTLQLHARETKMSLGGSPGRG